MKKYTRHSFFNAMDFWTFATFRNKWGPKNNIWPNFFVRKTCPICKTIVYICSKNINLIELWPTKSLFQKSTFLWKFDYTTFFWTKCSFAPKTKTNIFFWQCHVKAEGRSISEHPGVIPWPNNLRKKLLCELRQCSFTAPKKCTFFSISQRQTFFLPWKKKSTIPNDLHHWKGMTETICMPCFGESTYFDFGARIFSTQWPPCGAHILQGLINKYSLLTCACRASNIHLK